MPSRAEYAEILDKLAMATFVASRETLHDSHKDPYMIEDGFPVMQSTLRWRGAATLRWTHEYMRDQGTWRRGHAPVHYFQPTEVRVTPERLAKILADDLEPNG